MDYLLQFGFKNKYRKQDCSGWVDRTQMIKKHIAFSQNTYIKMGVTISIVYTDPTWASQ